MTSTLHIINELNQLALVSDFVEQEANSIGLEELQLMQVKLALEEAVTNAILYAYPSEEAKEICIEMDCQNGRLLITVTDSGIPFNPLDKEDPDLTLPPEERPIGGLGVYLVKQLMTDVIYSRSAGKNRLTMIKNIQ